MEFAASSDTRIRNVLGRLEMILDNENSRIGVDPSFDLRGSNARKSRCLYELTMLQRDVLPVQQSDLFVSQTKHIRAKLELNSSKVGAHMEACRSVVDLLKAAAQEAEADGIYSQEQFRYGEV
ncbi:hypothetical protein BJF92_17055 [Rhizobium rhizosphaerae]|uniref:Uncharacterized protein n=1 Tax=Xaviernesmea rhizosphaerae TaxID=1672749 RepID=A0A1Q9AIQ5_9HYPH|nr:hypothetical protein [Xaviernesmea rhizosphaerae]OLP55104.1 hypothetical protein BJF92_17055 [Xaviernesmea rhizosphaerae]OQP84366.1 hypothetical protein BTR14_19550 [Xaviernesmea rhizosphaerae]